MSNIYSKLIQFKSIDIGTVFHVWQILILTEIVTKQFKILKFGKEKDNNKLYKAKKLHKRNRKRLQEFSASCFLCIPNLNTLTTTIIL